MWTTEKVTNATYCQQARRFSACINHLGMKAERWQSAWIKMWRKTGISGLRPLRIAHFAGIWSSDHVVHMKADGPESGDGLWLAAVKRQGWDRGIETIKQDMMDSWDLFGMCVCVCARYLWVTGPFDDGGVAKLVEETKYTGIRMGRRERGKQTNAIS